MIEGKTSDQRHVIPRWRSIKQAQAAGEFSSIRSNKAAKPMPFDTSAVLEALRADFLQEKKNWSISNQVSDAEELLTSAIALGERSDEAVLAAAVAVAAEQTTAPAMAAFAEQVIHGKTEDNDGSALQGVHELRSEIAARKHLLSLNPRDGLLQAELALMHLNLGQHKKAEKVVTRALKVLPNHRYVLRSAARFWCHEGKPDKALYVLQQSDRTQVDPWLKAAELAVEALAGKSPSRWKVSKELIKSGRFSLHAVSELASQVGTFELIGGSRKQALNLLKLGASNPTENAAAQIEFVGREMAAFEPDEFLTQSPEAYEAIARKAYWKREWTTSLAACEAWHMIEPFSTSPAIYGTFVASVRRTSLERGLALATSVLNANPNDALLLNNLAVIHAYIGNIEKAKSALLQSRANQRSEISVTHKATEGLIEFRNGNFSEGIRLYGEAIKIAIEKSDYIQCLRAYCFLGREMSRASAAWADLFGKEVDKTVEKLKSRGYKIPRDVEVIRSQYVDEKPNDFGPLSLVPPVIAESIEKKIDQ